MVIPMQVAMPRNPSSELRKHHAGFTLIELMATLVIFGIMASLAAPSVSGYVEHQRVQSMANELVADIAFARMLAIRTGERVSLEIHGSRHYSVGRQSAGADGRKHVRLTMGRLAKTNSQSDVIVFDSRGMVRPEDAGTFQVTLGERTQAVKLSPAGRVYREN